MTDPLEGLSDEQVLELRSQYGDLSDEEFAAALDGSESPSDNRVSLTSSIDPGPAPFPTPDWPKVIQTEANRRFMNDIGDPAFRLAVGAAGGYAGAGLLASAVPAIGTALTEGGLLGRIAAGEALSVAGNAGAQAPLSMIDDTNFFHEMNPATHPIQSALSYGLPLAAEGLRAGGNWLNSANRTEDMRGVFSQNNADFIPSAGKMGVPAALDEIAPIIDDPSIASSKKPISELASRVSAAKELAGQRVGTIVSDLDEAGASIPRNMMDPAGVLPEQVGGTSNRAADAVANVEYEAMTKKAFTDARGAEEGINAYNRFSQVRKLAEAETNPALFEPHPGAGLVLGQNPEQFFEYQNAITKGRSLSKRLAGGAGTASDVDVLEELTQTVRNYDDFIKANLDSELAASSMSVGNSPAGAGLVHKLRQDFDAKAGFPENRGTIREEQYRALADNLRGHLQGMADKFGMGDDFAAANRRYSALAEMDPLIQNSAAPELRSSPSFNSDVMSLRVRGRPPYVTPQVTSSQGGSAKGTQKLLRRAYGETWPQKLGENMGEFGGSVEGVTGDVSGLSRALSDMRTPENRFPAGTEVAPRQPQFAPPIQNSPLPQTLTPNLVPPAVPPAGPYLLPRTMTQTDPLMVEFMINHFSAPQDAPLRTVQWKRLVAAQDLEGMATFLGALKEASPDIPMGPGPITGLNSEFDLGDGRSRLFSPLDQMKWLTQIQNSPLREDEKAQRVSALNRDGTVYPLDVRVNEFSDSSIRSLITEDTRSASMANFSYAPREQTSFGSRKSQSVER